MTQEEKAKAYDKALEVAQRFYKNSVAITKKGLEDMFPELAESENERIRKAISQCVEDMRGQFEKLYRVHHKDAIAWLEKQGQTFTQKDIDDAYLKGVCDAKNELEKQGEQNVWSEEDEIRWNNIILMVEAAFVGEEEKKYAEWLKSLKGRFVPQTKREWSHEDEKMLRDIDACIAKLPVFYSKIEINGEEKTCSDFIINARHWLKSLRS